VNSAIDETRAIRHKNHFVKTEAMYKPRMTKDYCLGVFKAVEMMMPILSEDGMTPDEAIRKITEYVIGVNGILIENHKRKVAALDSRNMSLTDFERSLNFDISCCSQACMGCTFRIPPKYRDRIRWNGGLYCTLGIDTTGISFRYCPFKPADEEQGDATVPTQSTVTTPEDAREQ